MLSNIKTGYWILIVIFLWSCNKDQDPELPPESIDVQFARLGSMTILNNNTVDGMGDIIIGFTHAIQVQSNDYFTLSNSQGAINDQESWNTNQNQVTISYDHEWIEGDLYTIQLNQKLIGTENAELEGWSTSFSIQVNPLSIVAVVADSTTINTFSKNPNIAVDAAIKFIFSHPITTDELNPHLELEGVDPVNFTLNQISDREIEIEPSEELRDYTTHLLEIKEALGESVNRSFDGYESTFFTGSNNTLDFPLLSDEELLTKVQETTFKYFWDFGHPVSGLARERNSSGQTVTSGGSGFGLMAMIVAVERGFISREEAIERWKTVVAFLDKAERFHGAWSHWLDGTTGKVRPFSTRDNGGDLVETAFLVQGLMTVRQYLYQVAPAEQALIDQIDALWQAVEWNWFTRDQKVLYWHWSPDYDFQINLPIRGHNETQIIYILAAASPDHGIDKEIYVNGYTRNGDFRNGNSFYGIELPLGSDYGGPLFFSHYSYLGMDPRSLSDQYVNYWTQNVNQSKINYAYCIDNPKRFNGYSESVWGLTASDSDPGYTAHSPTNDRGVITPTAAISSLPYTPEESMQAIRHFYYELGDRLWGTYGFYDAFSLESNWVADSYLAIDQGPIVCMIENYRSGLLWDLFMSAPEIQDALNKLGFEF